MGSCLGTLSHALYLLRQAMGREGALLVAAGVAGGAAGAHGGAGAGLVSGGSTLFVPVGLSLGRRVDPQGSTVSIVPYVQPTVQFVAGSGRTSALEFGFGVGADFRLSRVLDARVSGGLGDHPLTGVSIGAVYVH